MERGNISNVSAPTIAIDVDELIVVPEKKLFGLIKTFRINEEAIYVCEYHLMKGRMIYLLSHYLYDETEKIRKLLDEEMFPYTRLIHVQNPKKREIILGLPHVHFYFYSNPLNAATDNKRKEKQIVNITEALSL